MNWSRGVDIPLMARGERYFEIAFSLYSEHSFGYLFLSRLPQAYDEKLTPSRNTLRKSDLAYTQCQKIGGQPVSRYIYPDSQ